MPAAGEERHLRYLAARDTYEPLNGRRPAFVLDEHPDGAHVALMVVDSPYNRAAVWDRRARRAAWAPEATQALCWLPGGKEVVLVRDGLRGPGRQPRFVFERRSWPGVELLSACPVESDEANWCAGMAASPRGSLVAVAWLEQHVGGFELIAIRPDGDRQIPGAGYAVEPNAISDPVFSPDGRYLVLGCGRLGWWNRDEDPDLPSPGGRFLVGHVLTRDLDAGLWREIPIEEEVPAGWLPDAAGGEAAIDRPIGDPRFESLTDFTVRLATGRVRRVSVFPS